RRGDRRDRRLRGEGPSVHGGAAEGGLRADARVAPPGRRADRSLGAALVEGRRRPPGRPDARPAVVRRRRVAPRVDGARGFGRPDELAADGARALPAAGALLRRRGPRAGHEQAARDPRSAAGRLSETRDLVRALLRGELGAVEELRRDPTRLHAARVWAEFMSYGSLESRAEAIEFPWA